jgi:hypothetical protein
MGSVTPMRPVEQTSTCRHFRPSEAATASVMRFACSMPRGPVQALAFPALATIARMSALRRLAIETRTGAALTRFVVKVPAATVGCGE